MPMLQSTCSSMYLKEFSIDWIFALHFEGVQHGHRHGHGHVDMDMDLRSHQDMDIGMDTKEAMD